MLALAAIKAPQTVRAEETRAPKLLERAYVGLAMDMEDHAVCKKISPRALERAPFNSFGTQVYYTRSACFFYLAARTLNPYLCGEVKEAKGGLFTSGSYFSAASCERLVGQGHSMVAQFPFDHELVLRALGYTDADLRDEGWTEFYYGFQRDNDGSLQHRLKNLPDFSKD
jgi:hypothetical protein